MKLPESISFTFLPLEATGSWRRSSRQDIGWTNVHFVIKFLASLNRSGPESSARSISRSHVFVGNMAANYVEFSKFAADYLLYVELPILPHTSIQDGMDQSKWSLPRLRDLLKSKECNGLNRPRAKIHCVWCHNVSLNLFICHPQLSADSSLILECFSLVLEETVQTFQRSGRDLPTACMAWDIWLHYACVSVES